MLFDVGAGAVKSGQGCATNCTDLEVSGKVARGHDWLSASVLTHVVESFAAELVADLRQS